MHALGIRKGLGPRARARPIRPLSCHTEARARADPQRPSQSLMHAPPVKRRFPCKSSWMPTPARWIIKLIIIGLSCRIGEAQNPGPELHVGVMNPTGVMHKSNLLSQLPYPAIWGISETHLSARGIPMFRRELHHEAPALNFVPGYPVPLKGQGLHCTGGRSFGVGVVTSVPCRNLPSAIPQEVIQSARVQVFACLWGEQWISGGLVYGFAESANTNAVKAQTDELFDHVYTRIVEQSTGKRFIGGDFNQSVLGLATARKLLERGWIEVQDFAQQQWQQTPIATSRSGNRIDHLWISPELQPYLQSVSVSEVGFADHLAVIGKFSSWQQEPRQPIWRQPSPIPWHEIHHATANTQLQLEHFCSLPSLSKVETSAESSQQYSELCQALEATVQKTRHAAAQAPLPPNMLGRASTFDVTWKPKQRSPLKKSREGDHAPEFFGDSYYYACYFKQLRRIQHLDRAMQSITKTENTIAHCQPLWRAVCGAKGFKPSFGSWATIHLPQPLECTFDPNTLPESTSTSALHEAYLTFVRQQEKQLVHARQLRAKERRKENPNLVFSDIKAPNALPVQVLLAKENGVVKEIDEDEHAIILEKPIQVNTSQPLCTKAEAHPVIHADADKVWLDGETLPPLGTVIWQTSFTGTLHDLFEAFGQEWDKRWGRHNEVDASRWQPIIDFATQVIEPIAMPFSPISVEEIARVINPQKQRSATGPDGLSMKDIANAPSTWKQGLVRLFANIEAGQPWPSQLLQGHVTAVEKVEAANCIQQFRPICVLPAAYRVWATIRARQLLRHLIKFAPDHLYGSIPKKSAEDMIVALQLSIEASYAFQVPLSGAVIDLIKCFNTLPRIPLLAIGRLLGMPQGLLQAWTASLVQLQRRFKVRGAIGPILGSSTGFAEGDPLSVAAMFIFNIVADRYSSLQAPRVNMWSYVDNIELTGPTAGHVQDGMQHVTKFCELMDVFIDEKKSYFWSTATNCRAEFRNARASTCTAARDLGGHVCYSLKSTNFTLTARMDGCKELWSRLSRSVAPTRQKLRAIHTAIWPKALHGIATIQVGKHKMQELRAAAMKALGAAKKGANAYLHLGGCNGPRSDPWCFSLLASLRSFRKRASTEIASWIFSHLATSSKQRFPPGPNAVIYARLTHLGWTWIHDLTFMDGRGFQWDLLSTPIQVLTRRLLDDWFSRVGDEVQSRPSFAGMEAADFSYTKASLDGLPPEHRSLVEKALNGTFFTNDKLIHAGKAENTKCNFCNAEDSPSHRFWHCPHFAEFRLQGDEEVNEYLMYAPACVTNHGWICKNMWDSDLDSCLCQIADLSGEWMATPSRRPHMWDVFTDGSGFLPELPRHRLATWGAAIGQIEDSACICEPPMQTHFDAATGNTFQYWVLSQGQVPGLQQTVLRGEIWGAISALRWGVYTRCPVRIWCDNLQVCRFLQRAFQRQPAPLDDMRDNDLWRIVWELANHPSQTQSSVVKVAAHQDSQKELPSADLFAFHGNEVAHKLANTAKFQIEPSFWKVWHQHRNAEQLRFRIRSVVHQTILQVSLAAVKQQRRHDAEVPAGPAYQKPSVQSFVSEDRIDQIHFPDHFGTRDHPLIEAWLHKRLQTGGQLRWVSIIELLREFQTSTGLCGMEFEHKRWIPGHWTPQKRDSWSWKVRCRYFAKYLHALSRKAGFSFQTHVGKSNSQWFALWTSVIYIHWTDECAAVAEDHLPAQGIVVKTLRDLQI